jgi:hypothetical protein
MKKVYLFVFFDDIAKIAAGALSPAITGWSFP